MRLPGDSSVMTYAGHMVKHTLLRCRFSPTATTGQVGEGEGEGEGNMAYMYVYMLLNFWLIMLYVRVVHLSTL